MPKEDTVSTKKNNMSLQKALRKDWVSSHKGILIGTTACVVAAAAAIALTITRPWVSEAHVLDQTAAIVDGDKITEQEVADYVDQYRRYIGKTTDADWATFLDENSMTADTVRSQALNRLEQQLIIKKAAQAGNITASKEEIDEKVAEQREKANLKDDDQAWNTWLSDMGYTEDSYRKELEYGIIEDKYVATQITPVEPSDYSMQTKVSSDIDSYTGRKAYRILFKLDMNATASQVNEVKAKAQAVIDELGEKPSKDDVLKKGDELAKSKDVVAGDMGWDCISSYEVLVQKALDELEAGQLYKEPIRDGKGFNVIYCTETYLPDEDGNIDFASMPAPIAKALRADTYEESNKNPKNSYLMFLPYNHNIDAKDMPEGLPYDVDMSLSTYHANDETTDASAGTDGTVTIGENGTTTSADGSTIVTTTEATGDEATDAESEDKKPAVEPSDPTTIQTFGDSSEADADAE